MKKRLLSLVLSALLALPISAFAGYENFRTVRPYQQGQFSDVLSTDWFADHVQTAYELGLVSGKTAAQFDPDGSLTIAETIKLAACVHSIYHTGAANFVNGSPWFRPYVDYAKQNGIISAEYSAYDQAVTRAQFAQICGSALPAEALPEINDVEDGAIADVSQSTRYGTAVYLLYRAGVLTGDSDGSFHPAEAITRSEAVAIVTRMADRSLRRSVTLINTDKEVMTAEQIFRSCSPAVFYIEVYDAVGNAMSSGSGVFLSADGVGMTNYHVIEGAASAQIRAADGKIYAVKGVYAASEEYDLARIQVDGAGFSSLTTMENVSTGALAYAIGSPLGLENTISQGIVSSASRMVNGREYIQTTASISPGSSGGALLDAKGRLIGITSAYIDGGQNLNLAIPVSYFSEVTGKTLHSMAQINGVGMVDGYYLGFYPAPDFGAFAGVEPFSKTNENGVVQYSYSIYTIGSRAQTVINHYAQALQDEGFSYYGSDYDYDYKTVYYRDRAHEVVVAFSIVQSYGMEYVVIGLSNQ